MSYITGFHAIEERIKAGQTQGPLLVAKAGPRAKSIEALAHERGIRTDRTGTAELDRLAPGHRGIALLVNDSAAESSNVDLELFLEELAEKKDVLVVVLDEVTDPHNYGAIIRSCDQFGAALVVTRNRRIARHADVVEKTSAGAAAWVKTSEVPNLPRALELLKKAGFWIYGADIDGEPLYKQDFCGRKALVLGGEAGLSRLLRQNCDIVVTIPSKGRIDSLNVSVAAGVILYEMTRKNR